MCWQKGLSQPGPLPAHGLFALLQMGPRLPGESPQHPRLSGFLRSARAALRWVSLRLRWFHSCRRSNMESRGSLGRPGVCSLEPPQPGFQFRGHVIVTVPGCGGRGFVRIVPQDRRACGPLLAHLQDDGRPRFRRRWARAAPRPLRSACIRDQTRAGTQPGSPSSLAPHVNIIRNSSLSIK